MRLAERIEASLQSKRNQKLLLVIFFSLVGALRFAESFAPVHTLANAPDGRGTIGWIYDLHDNVSRRGAGVLWGDRYVSDSIGGGLNTPGSPTNPFWKTYYWLAGYVLQPFDAYDLTAYLSFILIVVVSYTVGRSLALGAFLAALLAFFLVSLYHFDTRVEGHLTFVTYFMPIGLFGLCWQVYRHPGLRSGGMVGLGLWLTFCLNEYYGYFGIYAVASMLLLWALVDVIRQRGRSLRQWLLAGVCMVVVFSSAMVLTFPKSLLGDNVPQGTQAEFVALHNQQEFEHFSVPDPWKLFKSEEGPFQWVMPDFLQRAGVSPEYTNRVGFEAIVLLLLAGLCMIARRRVMDDRDRRWLVFALGSAAVIVVMCLLALKPGHPWSLAPVTMSVAPMFRFSVRSLLYAQIAAVLLSFLAVSTIWRYRPEGRFWTCGFSFLLTTALLCQYWQLRDHHGPKLGLKTDRMSIEAHFSALRALPEGMLLHIPFYYPKQFPPENDYLYIRDRFKHGMPILNGMNFRQHRPALDRAGDLFGINQLTAAKLEILASSGIRYLLVEGRSYLEAHVLSSSAVKELYRKDRVALFELEGARPAYDQSVLVEEVFYKRPYVYGPDYFFSKDVFETAGANVVVPLRGQTGAGATLNHKTIFLEGGAFCAEFRFLADAAGSSGQLSIELGIEVKHQHLSTKKNLALRNAPDLVQEKLCFAVPIADDVTPTIAGANRGDVKFHSLTIVPSP